MDFVQNLISVQHTFISLQSFSRSFRKPWQSGSKTGGKEPWVTVNGSESRPKSRGKRRGGGSQETEKKTIRASDWTTERRCSIRREELWELQKSRLQNKKTVCARPAILYGRFEQVNSDLEDIDKKFYTEFGGE